MSARRETRVTVDVERVERLGCSRLGNPRYALHTTRGRYLTSSDAACSYSVSNLVGRASRTGQRGITLVLTAAGRVTDFYRLIDGQEVRP